MSDDGSGNNAVQLKQSTWNSLLRTFNEGYLHTHTHTHTHTRNAVRKLPLKAISIIFISVYKHDHRKCGLWADVYSCRLLKGKFYTLYENLREHPINFFSYFRMNISTFDGQQLAYLEGDVILRLSLGLGVRAVIYFSRRATVGTHNYRRLSAGLEDTIVLLLSYLTVCAVLLTP